MNDIKDLQEQFENLIKQGQELLEKMKEERIADNNKTKRWKPEKDERYYTIWRNGTVDYCPWDDDICDNACFKLGNVFQTYEEAQKELNRRRAEQELLDMVDAKMSDENRKWLIEYDPRGPVFYPNDTFFHFTTPFLFSSKESCQKAIDTLGTEKLNLIFRID